MTRAPSAQGGLETRPGKVAALLQAYISRARLESFSLVADSCYVSANAGRLCRALFEICLRRGWPSATSLFLEYSKAVELRLWPHQHPLRQFEGQISPELLWKIEDRGKAMEMEALWDMTASEIGAMLRHPAAGPIIKASGQRFFFFLRDAPCPPRVALCPPSSPRLQVSP